MTQEILRLKKLAGLKLMEAAEGEVITPSQDDLDDERLAALDARADVEAQIEANILFAFRKVGVELKDGGSVYFDTDDTVEALVNYDTSGVPLDKLVALANCGLGSGFSVAPSGDYLQIRFTIDPNLAAGSPIGN